jgi:hypothetical protein
MTTPIVANRSLTVAALSAHRSRDRQGAVGEEERQPDVTTLPLRRYITESK